MKAKKRKPKPDPRDEQIERWKMKCARLRGQVEELREESYRLRQREENATAGSETLRQCLVSTERENGRLVDSHNKMVKFARMLERCRVIMEANDPGNAREIFGEPPTLPLAVLP